jgi:hypothetical protein
MRWKKLAWPAPLVLEILVQGSGQVPAVVDVPVVDVPVADVPVADVPVADVPVAAAMVEFAAASVLVLVVQRDPAQLAWWQLEPQKDP